MDHMFCREQKKYDMCIETVFLKMMVAWVIPIDTVAERLLIQRDSFCKANSMMAIFNPYSLASIFYLFRLKIKIMSEAADTRRLTFPPRGK